MGHLGSYADFTLGACYSKTARWDYLYIIKLAGSEPLVLESEGKCFELQLGSIKHLMLQMSSLV